MKKFYTMLLALVCSLAIMQAQWSEEFDGGSVPSAAADWEISSNGPGDNFISDVLNDPYISGNEIFRYFAPDENSSDGSQSARTYYRWIPKWFTSNEVTVVTRIKGIPIDSLTKEVAMVIEVGNGSVRSVLNIITDDSTLVEKKGDAADTTINGVDFADWNIYRITISSDDSVKVYLNEGTVPVMAGLGDASGAMQTRFGDDGGNRVAGFVDWYLIDSTGAYAPGAGTAIPAAYSTDFGPQAGDKPGAGIDLVYVTKTINKHADGYYADSMNVDNLVQAGFNVTVPDYTTINTKPFFDAIDAAKIVVIGRDVASSDFSTADQISYWEKLQKPVILMSAYLARDNRLRWLPTKTLMDYSHFGEMSTKLELPSDDAFAGVIIPSDSIIHYSTDNITFVNIFDSVRANVNGEILSTFVNGGTAYEINQGSGDTSKTVDMSVYDGMPLMIRWAPVADSMYSGISNGAASVRPFGWRTFIPGGGDKDWDYTLATRKYAMDVYSDEMKSVIVNEAVYLLSLPVPDISVINTLDTVYTDKGTISPDFSSATTSYTVAVPKGTTSLTLTAVATDAAKATVEGAGVIDLEGKTDSIVTITCTSEAGTVKSYLFNVKEAIDVAGNVIPAGTGTIEEYLAKGEYEEYLLINGAKYVTLEPIIISSKVTLKAQDTVFLPLGDDMPMVVNDLGVSNIFALDNGADLSLIGIDFDGLSTLGFGKADRIVAMRADLLEDGKPGNVIENIYVNRCKMHNIAQSAIGANTKSDSVTIKNVTFINSYVYDSELRGVYIKDFHQQVDVNPYVFKNITYWSIGQQFNWIQVKTPGVTSKWVFDHITGYDLGTAGDKELWGNSEKEAKYDIQFTNIILSEQKTSTQPSLYFTSQDGNSVNNFHTHDIHNIVLHNVNEVKTRGVGERGDASDVITMTNVLTADPQFADPVNGNFTVGNADYLTAGDDGTILGAEYWAPGFVDDASDWGDGVSSISTHKSDLGVSVYPVPFENEINLEIVADGAETATISIYDLTGRNISLSYTDLVSGKNQVTIDASDIQVGTYFYRISTNTKSAAGQLIKVQ